LGLRNVNILNWLVDVIHFCNWTVVFERCLGYFFHNLQEIKQGRKKINIGIEDQKKNGCVTLLPCHLYETIS
jgi:hypothetical protein